MTLVLVRHGQSEWNLKNLFTGWYDAKLTDLGRNEALSGAKSLIENGQTEFDIAFTSALSRAQDTCKIILTELGLEGKIEVKKDEALNERNYGDLTGLNKDDAKAKWGAEQVHIWRRSYDVPPPGKTGESLELTAARTLPYYFKEILPAVLKDHPNAKVLVAAHGNSLRSIIMHLEGISKDEITELELETGVPIVYNLDKEGKVVNKKILKHKTAEKSGEKE